MRVVITQLVCIGLIATTNTYAFSSLPGSNSNYYIRRISDNAPRIRSSSTKLYMSDMPTDFDKQQQQEIDELSLRELKIVEEDEPMPYLTTIPSTLWSMLTGNGGRPPIQVDDTNVLFYDVLLLLNLSVSISFGVTHRMNLSYISSALDEGSLMCICWIIAGLGNGVFLYSAVDGHYDPLGRGEDDGDKGGPKSAGLLALSTFISASSIRILIALSFAVCQHRPVGVGGEELIPLEIVVGLALMSLWRAVHSSYTPRV